MLTKLLFRTLLAATATALLIAPGLSHPTEAQETTPGSGGRIGIFHIIYGHASVNYQKTGIDAVLTNGSNGLAKVTTNLYDASAKRIELTLVQTAGATKPTQMIATGTVRMVIREQNGRKTIATCDKAIYTAGATKADPGVLRLIGHAHTETQDKLLAQPLVSDNDSATITIMPDQSTLMDFDNGSGQGEITGQPYEPAPKAKAKP